MSNLVFYLFASYGVCFALMTDKVMFTVFLRNRWPFFEALFQCSFCTGFHCGWLVWLLRGFFVGFPAYWVVDLFLWCFATAAFCYIVDVIVQWFEAKIDITP